MPLHSLPCHTEHRARAVVAAGAVFGVVFFAIVNDIDGYGGLIGDDCFASSASKPASSTQIVNVASTTITTKPKVQNTQIDFYTPNIGKGGCALLMPQAHLSFLLALFSHLIYFVMDTLANQSVSQESPLPKALLCNPGFSMPAPFWPTTTLRLMHNI